MIITYPVNTFSMADAIKTAMGLARASGYKSVVLSKAIQVNSSSWEITLVVM